MYTAFCVAGAGADRGCRAREGKAAINNQTVGQLLAAVLGFACLCWVTEPSLAVAKLFSGVAVVCVCRSRRLSGP